jgi:hypothetical protein
VSAAIAKVFQTKQDVVKRLVQARAEIKESFENLRAEVQAREKKAMEQLSGHEHQKHKILQAQMEALTNFKSGLTSCSGYVQRTLDGGSDAAVLLSRPMLMQRLDELKQQEHNYAPLTTADLWLEKQSVDLSSFCHSCVPTVTHTTSIAAGPGLENGLAVNEEATFTVTLNQSDGTRSEMPHLRSILSVKVLDAGISEGADADGGDVGAGVGAGAVEPPPPPPPPAVVIDNNDGTFTCKYTPTNASRALQIRVAVLGNDVPQSPFVVHPSAWPVLRVVGSQSAILSAEMLKNISRMMPQGTDRRTLTLIHDLARGQTAGEFDAAVKTKSHVLTVIKCTKNHVFGCYFEDTFGTGGGWIPGSANNFLFSLGTDGSGSGCRWKRGSNREGIHITSCGLHLGQKNPNLVAFCSWTFDTDGAAGDYEADGEHCKFGTPPYTESGDFTPATAEVYTWQ